MLSLLSSLGLYLGGNLLDKPLKDGTWPYFDEAASTVCDHCLHALGPAYRSGELCDEVTTDRVDVCRGGSGDVLIDWATWSVELRGLDCSLQLYTGWLHQRRVEGTADVEAKGTLGTSLLEQFASLVYALDAP